MVTKWCLGNYSVFHRLFVNFVLALISMNIRILSGFLFLLSAIITIPLVLLVVTLIIPILFFIIAIMMFVRKNKVETVPNYYNGGYGYQPYEEMPEQEAYTHHNETENEPVEEPQQRRRPSRRSMERKEQAYDTTTGSANQIQDEQESYDDKYEQFPKRAVESEYRSDDNEQDEEPTLLSRQAKYNKSHVQIRILQIIKMYIMNKMMKNHLINILKNLKLILKS